MSKRSGQCSLPLLYMRRGLCPAVGYIGWHHHHDPPTRATTDAKSRQVVNNRPVVSNLAAASPLPQKVSRVRTRSATVTSPPAPVARKRTSSGVFQVDELEPVAKKIDVESPQKQSEAPNGRHTQAGNKDNGKQETVTRSKDKSKSKDDKIKIINKFDSKAKSNCVSAFKESDLWD